MSNALDALGFAEEDDRIVEQDAWLRDVLARTRCDDMFALIAELSSSGETWKIQFRADLAPDRLLSHTLNRHRSIVAHEQQVVPQSGDGAGSKGPELPVQDLDTSQGKNEFRRAMRGVSRPTFSRRLAPVLMVALAPASCSETLDEFLPRLPVQMNHRFALRFARQSPS